MIKKYLLPAGIAILAMTTPASLAFAEAPDQAQEETTDDIFNALFGDEGILKNVIPEDRMATFGHLVVKTFQILGVQDEYIVGGMPSCPLIRPRADPGGFRLFSGVNGKGGHLVMLLNEILDIIHIQHRVSDSGIE